MKDKWDNLGEAGREVEAHGEYSKNVSQHHHHHHHQQQHDHHQHCNNQLESMRVFANNKWHLLKVQRQRGQVVIIVQLLSCVWLFATQWTEALQASLSFTILRYSAKEDKLLLLFNCSVVSDSLQPSRLQHSRLPCPSPSPGVCSNSCPLSWWLFKAFYCPKTTKSLEARGAAVALFFL